MSDNRTDNPAGAILDALSRIRRSILLHRLGRVTFRLAAVVSGSALALLAVERYYYLPGVWRLILLILAGLVLTGVIAQAAWIAWRKYGSLRSVARLCDFNLPELKNRLETSIEFIRSGYDSRGIYSRELVEAALEQTSSVVSRPGFRETAISRALAPDRRAVRVEGYVAAALCALLLISGFVDPLLFERTYRGFGSPLELIRRERDFRIFVQPGDITLLRGERLIVRAAGSIVRPDEMLLESWQTGRVRETYSMPYISEQFEHRLDLGPVENDLSYVVSQSGTASDTFRVRVTSNPFITELRLRYEYPAYTGLPPYETARDKAIQGLRGTRITLDGRSSNPLSTATLILGVDSLRSLEIHEERGFSDTLTLDRDTYYSFRLEDSWGLVNTDSLVYPIVVTPDEPPRIALLYPEKESKLGEQMQQALMYEAADDFGFGRMVLNFRKMNIAGRESEPRNFSLPLPERGSTHLFERYDWDLRPLRLLPGESVVYSLTVWDNDRVSGPKSASTGEYKLRFPTIQEIIQQGEQEQQEIASRLADLESQGQSALEQVQKMQEALERGSQMDWQEKQRLGQALERQKEIAEQVGDLAERMKQSVEQLQRGESMSPELLEKLVQVQKLMEEVATEEMKELMARIQESMERIDPGELARDIEKLKFSQEKFLERLDKTLSVLEKIRLEQQMDFLVNRTRELARTAESLADSMAAAAGEDPGQVADNTNERSDRPGGDKDNGADAVDPEAPDAERGGEPGLSSLEQELLEKNSREALDQLDQLTEDVFERMENTAGSLAVSGENELASNLEKEVYGPDREYFSQAWSDVSNKMESGRPGEAGKTQREAGRRMRDMHDRLQDYSELLKEKWKNEVSEAMLRAFDDLDFLARRQEQIAAAVESEPDINHPDVLELAVHQREVVQGLSRVQSGLADAARDNFFISGRLLDIVDAAVARGENSTGLLSAEQRNREQAADASVGVLAAINAGMLSLLEQQQNMMESGSGVGLDQMMKSMEQIARRQEELNRRMREQMQSGQQGDGSEMSGSGAGLPQPSPGDLMEMLRRMAAEQNAIREQLARLAEQAGKSNETGRLESALEGMAKEAEEVVKDLLQRGVSPETFERQRRLLDRLLSAQRSLQQRDSQDNERKSETAGSYTPLPPPQLPAGLLESEDSANELKLLLERWKGAYPESYESLIRTYYERIRTRNLESGGSSDR